MRVIYDLPNPFMQVSAKASLSSLPSGESDPAVMLDCALADREAAALEPISTPGGVAAEPVGYQCCADCGVREPCDEHCPHGRSLTETEEVLMWKSLRDSAEFQYEPTRFQLDEAALMSEIEPVPAFISRRTTAEEIEALLELARAEEWPAPPFLRRANG